VAGQQYEFAKPLPDTHVKVPHWQLPTKPPQFAGHCPPFSVGMVVVVVVVVDADESVSAEYTVHSLLSAVPLYLTK
jgi:hypothetical protein